MAGVYVFILTSHFKNIYCSLY